MYLAVVYGSVFAGGSVAGKRLEEAIGCATVPNTVLVTLCNTVNVLQ